MIVVNNVETDFQLETIQWLKSNVTAFSINKDVGEKIIAITSSKSIGGVKLEISMPSTKLHQCLSRFAILMRANSPIIAYETFFDCAPRSSNIDSMIQGISSIAIISEKEKLQQQEHFSFYVQILKHTSLHWENMDRIVLLCAVHAAHLIHSAANIRDIDKLWLTLGERLQSAGYFQASKQCFRQSTLRNNATSASIRAQLGFAISSFMIGDITAAILEYKQIKDYIQSNCCIYCN